MRINKIKQANQYVRSATVFQVATIDHMGFPNLVSLTPLPTNRSVTSVLFYTEMNTATVRNLAHSPNAAIICFKESEYSSLMLKGSLRVDKNMVSEIQLDLDDFQRNLNYEQAVVLRFKTMSMKFRQQNHIDYESL